MLTKGQIVGLQSYWKWAYLNWMETNSQYQTIKLEMLKYRNKWWRPFKRERTKAKYNWFIPLYDMDCKILSESVIHMKEQKLYPPTPVNDQWTFNGEVISGPTIHMIETLEIRGFNGTTAN